MVCNGSRQPGRLFHSVGPETEKALAWNVFLSMNGISYNDPGVVAYLVCPMKNLLLNHIVEIDRGSIVVHSMHNTYNFKSNPKFNR